MERMRASRDAERQATEAAASSEVALARSQNHEDMAASVAASAQEKRQLELEAAEKSRELEAKLDSIQAALEAETAEKAEQAEEAAAVKTANATEAAQAVRPGCSLVHFCVFLMVTV